jgi:hypothetical protein
MALAVKFRYFTSSPLNLLFKFCAQVFNILLRKSYDFSIFLLRIYNNSIFLSFNYILGEGKFYSFRGWDYLPPALIINGEFDVLRDEGEAYAHKLIEAGVPVTAIRYHGIIHDFVMLNPITDTPRYAIAHKLI